MYTKNKGNYNLSLECHLVVKLGGKYIMFENTNNNFLKSKTLPKVI